MFEENWIKPIFLVDTANAPRELQSAFRKMTSYVHIWVIKRELKSKWLDIGQFFLLFLDHTFGFYGVFNISLDILA